MFIPIIKNLKYDSVCFSTRSKYGHSFPFQINEIDKGVEELWYGMIIGTDNYCHVRNGRAWGRNGSVKWIRKAEGDARHDRSSWSEDVIIDLLSFHPKKFQNIFSSKIFDTFFINPPPPLFSFFYMHV